MKLVVADIEGLNRGQAIADKLRVNPNMMAKLARGTIIRLAKTVTGLMILK